MELYERTARTIKRIDSQLRVGGPASHGFGDHVGVPPWGKEFLAACAERNLPLDFFSTHPYPTLYPVDLEGRGYMTWDGPDRLLVDARGCDRLLRASAYPNVERHYTEWSSSPSPRDPVHDTAFLASFIVDNNWRARGLMDSLSFWVVSDIFEEGRQGDTPFHGGFGLVNIQGLKKASYHGYWFLSRLGDEVLAEGDSYAVTRRGDGTLAILLWNYCHYRDDANDSRLLAAAKPHEIYDLFAVQPPREFQLKVDGVGQDVRLQITRFDRQHGSVYDAWAAMGAPQHILPADLEVLRRRMELDVAVERIATPDGSLEWATTVQPFGVTLLEITVGLDVEFLVLIGVFICQFQDNTFNDPGTVDRAAELFVGANYHPHDSDPETWTRDIQLMQQAGFRVVRLGHLAWDSYEPKDGQFNFAWFDQVMDLIAGGRDQSDLGYCCAPRAPLAASQASLHQCCGCERQ